mmetsp:Transcript_241/g.658  ORF Transcript_241/g.658 Transcript_241/m.658 type:complete len:227 (+) Transcript_241:340-1020(+)
MLMPTTIHPGSDEDGPPRGGGNSCGKVSQPGGSPGVLLCAPSVSLVMLANFSQTALPRRSISAGFSCPRCWPSTTTHGTNICFGLRSSVSSALLSTSCVASGPLTQLRTALRSIPLPPTTLTHVGATSAGRPWQSGGFSPSAHPLDSMQSSTGKLVLGYRCCTQLSHAFPAHSEGPCWQSKDTCDDPSASACISSDEVFAARCPFFTWALPKGTSLRSMMSLTPGA